MLTHSTGFKSFLAKYFGLSGWLVGALWLAECILWCILWVHFSGVGGHWGGGDGVSAGVGAGAAAGLGLV